MYKQKAGELHVGSTRSGGKLVDEWTFLSPFKGKDAPKLVVQISIDKTKKDRVCFVAHSDCLAKKLEDTDIERLRQKVEEALRFQHDMLTGVPWADWLEVEVRGRVDVQRYDNSKESDLRITYRPLKRGVDSATGEAFVVNCNGVAEPFPTSKKADTGDEGDTAHELRGMNRRDKEAEYSYLPATAENIAALDELMSRTQTLRANLSAFLRQDKVQQSLADLTSRQPTLPAPL